MADPDDEAFLSWKHFVAGALAGTAEHTGTPPSTFLHLPPPPSISSIFSVSQCA
jgi:hypothetical protein